MGSHYFSSNGPLRDTQSLQKDPPTVEGEGRLEGLRYYTSPGVFSSGHLDVATEQLLIKAPQPASTGYLLDLGAGWGPLATAMAKESPQASVWAVDVNPAALALTSLNADINGLTNVLVLDEKEALKAAETQAVRFETIWSNPPVRIGKEAMRALLIRWLSLLTPTGSAYLVVGKNLGADSLARWLTGKGFVVERVASRKGFRILGVKLAPSDQ